MSGMFGNRIQPACAICQHGYTITEREQVICARNGNSAAGDHSCRRFEYDPIAREPLLPLRYEQYEPADFVL